MKRLTATLAICALLGAPLGAFATTFTWLGGTPVWGRAENWSGFGGPPGSGDTAFIDAGTHQPDHRSGTSIVGVITLDATSGPQTVSLMISGGTLTALGLVTAKGNQAASESKTATLNPTADDAFVPDSLFFWGRDHADRSHAIFDVDADVTVVTSTELRGYVDIDVADGKTADLDDVSVSSSPTVMTLVTNTSGVLQGDTLLIDANPDSAARSFEKAGAGTFTATDQVTVKADADDTNNARLLVSAGTFDVNAEVELWGGTSANSTAEVEVSSGATFTPNSIDLNGGNTSSRPAFLDFDNSVTVQNSADSTPDTVAEGYVEIDVEVSDKFIPKDMKVDASAAYAQIHQKTGTGEVEPTSLTISAGDAANEDALYQVSAGTLDVNGELRMDSGNAADRQAKFLVQSTADPVTVDTMDINGPTGNFPTSYAWLDFRDNVTVDGSTGPHTSFDGFVDVDLAASVTFDAKDMVIADSSADFQVTGANITTSILKYDSLVTNLGIIRFIGPLTVQEYD